MSGTPTHSDVFKKLKNLSSTVVQCQVATFVSYEKASQTIIVSLANGLKLPGVRLKAAVNKNISDYFVQIPKAKSTVLIGQIGASAEAGEYYLIMADQTESIEFKADAFSFKVNKTGLVVEKTTENLGKVLKDLIDEIKGLNILVIGTAGANPLTVTSAKPNPVNVTNLTLIAQRLEGLIPSE